MPTQALMTNTQLYLTIGVPMAFNGTLITMLMLYINHRFADHEKIFTEKLLRVEQVLDARLKHCNE